MLLSEAITRIRTLTDDADAVRWADSEITTALTAAQYEALLWALAHGANIFSLEAALSSSTTGSVSLTGIAPMKVCGVMQLMGSTRVRVRESQALDICTPVTTVQSLIVSYVPRPTFPASPAVAFTWGNGAPCPPLDSYLCVLAASELKVTEGEELPGLVHRKDELKAALQRLLNIPGFTVMPMGGRRVVARFVWARTALDTLQLGV